MTEGRKDGRSRKIKEERKKGRKNGRTEGRKTKDRIQGRGRRGKPVKEGKEGR